MVLGFSLYEYKKIHKNTKQKISFANVGSVKLCELDFSCKGRS